MDDGVGFHVKNEMGKLLDLWLTQDNNLELWMSEDGRFSMWQKRVLITDLLAQAWKNVCKGNEATDCKSFHFLASATRIGHNMTIDGSNDAHIHLTGIENHQQKLLCRHMPFFCRIFNMPDFSSACRILRQHAVFFP